MLTSNIFDILSVCGAGGANKTAIMYHSNLSHDQLVRYLGYLHDQGVLEVNSNGRFHLGEKGSEILEQVSQVIELLRDLRGVETEVAD